MQFFPLYINTFFLMLIITIRATHPFVQTTAAQYMYAAGPMLACHNALIDYADANPTIFGTISQAAVDSFLPPGISDPGLFTYIITSPGIVDTVLTSSASLPDPASMITLAQQLSAEAITAGVVQAGQIVPSTDMPPAAVPAGVANGAYAIQTTLRTH